jgi:hypothetical protein
MMRTQTSGIQFVENALLGSNGSRDDLGGVQMLFIRSMVGYQTKTIAATYKHPTGIPN